MIKVLNENTHQAIAVCHNLVSFPLLKDAFFLSCPQSHGQQQQHGAPDSLSRFPGSKPWRQWLQTPSQLLQPAFRTDLLQQWIRAPVRGWLLWLLRVAWCPVPGVLQYVNFASSGAKDNRECRKTDSAQAEGRMQALGILIGKLSNYQLRSDYWLLWPELASSQNSRSLFFSCYVDWVVLVVPLEATRWQHYDLKKYFLIHIFWFFLSFTYSFLPYLYKYVPYSGNK